MAVDAARAKSLFLAASDLADPAERVAYLEREYGGDLELRGRVEALLRANDASPLPPVEVADASSAHGSHRPPQTEAYNDPSACVGSVVAGKYKLIQEIGEGGMGRVYMAQQMEPVKRAVAVKVIKAGMDSRGVLARFDAERQALAIMDHPNIAKVLDAGTTGPASGCPGRPFFVMELMKGTPITRYCDEHKLTPRQRLELFVQVCQAIQHAHQKGIIHRDIKPSNVLVAMYDDRPVPKVIDFGVAKAAGEALTEKTLMTGFGTIVGTPEYMSPEQASLNNLDIDTRSDVYSLGVLLYELLTGATPVDRQSLGKAAVLEILRIVREVQAPRPSVKLSSIDTLPSVAANRGTELAKLSKLMQGELDWVLLKALEKDRTRRYESANALSRDIQRYLADEVVEARPPSTGYRVRKFVGRHKGRVAATAAFLALLLASVAVSSYLAVQAKRSEAIAEEKRIEAEENAAKAEANAKEAEQNADGWSKTFNQHLNAVENAEIRSVALKVDLDLAELRTDGRGGLLRLARPLKHTFGPVHVFGTNSEGTLEGNFSKHSMFVELREFATMAVLAAGQEFAPLLPPITHEGQAVVLVSMSPDHQTLLTLGKDYTARLWDARTAQPIAVLRQGDEQVVTCGFSQDSRTAFADDRTGVARFWDVPSGRFRTATEARPNRYEVSDIWHFGGGEGDACKISGSRLLTRRFVAKKSDDGRSHSVSWEGPVELWDTATGRLVARLDSPGCNFLRFQFTNGGLWITTLEGRSTLQVFSAEDGRLTRLSHPEDEVVDDWDVSPNGRHLATITRRPGDFVTLRVWDTETWQAGPVTTPSKSPRFFQGSFRLQFWMDDVLGGSGMALALGDDDGWKVNGWTVYRYGQSEPIAEFSGASVLPDLLGGAGDVAHGGNGWVYSTRTWQRLLPPPGRKFHPDLARFAGDGRFVPAAINSERVLIDTRTDKAIPTSSEWHFLPEFGMVATATADDRTTIRLIPLASRLTFPADMLELWAQVAVRGELSQEGQFVKWDEPTWELKREQLAAVPAPRPDVPFPGYVATDKLHWLRAEFGQAKSDADKFRLASELLRRAESAGDRAEAIRWRAEVEQREPSVNAPQ